MMNTFGAWALSILGLVIIGVVIDLLLPEGRMSKYLKAIFSTVMVLVIVLPIPSLIKNGFSSDGNFLIQNDFSLDENYLEYSNELKYSYLEKGVKKALEEDGVRNVGVEIVGGAENNIYKIKNVRINLRNSVIDENIQHINKYELVWNLVTNYLKVDKGIVIINE